MSDTSIGELTERLGEVLANAAKEIIAILREIVEAIAERLEAAGASSEAGSKPDGFLSYAAESHAVGYGIGLGFAAVAPHPAIKAFVLVAILANEANRWRLSHRFVREIREEAQYFIPTLALTALITAWLYGRIPV